MKTIFVGNLPATASEVELRALFEGFGEISGVDMMQGQDFAYVRMINDFGAGEAVRSLDGTKLYGKNLEVHEARSRHHLKHHQSKSAR